MLEEYEGVDRLLEKAICSSKNSCLKAVIEILRVKQSSRLEAGHCGRGSPPSSAPRLATMKR